MATDGVKIIDGDTAHDIYSTFEEMYNKGATVETLKEYYEKDKNQYKFLDEEFEICITTYALAFWEIGALTPEMLKEVEKVIGKKATVIGWTEEVSEQAGKARQRELDKFLKKISKPRVRAKKREVEKKPTFSNEEKQLMDEAIDKIAIGQYAAAAGIYEQLLEKNPDLHDARCNYVELLYEIPKKVPDCPPYNACYDRQGSEKHMMYTKYILTHTDWKEIEKHCCYMLTHRDTDRMEVSDKKKRKICEWYNRIIGAMSNTLMAQQRYAEAIPVIQEDIDFTLSRKGTDLGWVINDYTKIYACLLMMGDQQKMDMFIQKFLSLYPNNGNALKYKQQYLEKHGIEVFLA